METGSLPQNPGLNTPQTSKKWVWVLLVCIAVVGIGLFFIRQTQTLSYEDLQKFAQTESIQPSYDLKGLDQPQITGGSCITSYTLSTSGQTGSDVTGRTRFFTIMYDLGRKIDDETDLFQLSSDTTCANDRTAARAAITKVLPDIAGTNFVSAEVEELYFDTTGKTVNLYVPL